jgi:antitoxin component YwqK of YwqJK toxin-antitoxin module
MEDGNYKTYHKNGKVKHSVNYKDGKLNGLCEEFNEKEQALSLLNFKDGKLDGVCKWFEWLFENGSLEASRNYKNGELIN